MLDFPTWKKTWLWLITAVAIFAALPSLVSMTSAKWPEALPDPTVNLGLDPAKVEQRPRDRCGKRTDHGFAIEHIADPKG